MYPNKDAELILVLCSQLYSCLLWCLAILSSLHSYKKKSEDPLCVTALKLCHEDEGRQTDLHCVGWAVQGCK